MHHSTPAPAKRVAKYSRVGSTPVDAELMGAGVQPLVSVELVLGRQESPIREHGPAPGDETAQRRDRFREGCGCVRGARLRLADTAEDRPIFWSHGHDLPVP